jgi:membrane protein DedA with SNARE-associated domain
VFSAAGALGWAAVIGAAGYLLGNNLSLISTIIRDIGIGGLVLVVLIVVVVLVVRSRAVRR